jgi:hypothetical protein
MKHKYSSLIAAMVFGVAACGFARPAQVPVQAPVQVQETSHTGMWTGKTGHLTIHAPVKAGDTVLPAGDYEVRLIDQPDRSFVEFTRVVEIANPAYGIRRPPQASPLYAHEKVAEVSCTRAPLKAKARKTVAVISSENASLTRLEIKGASDAQLF